MTAQCYQRPCGLGRGFGFYECLSSVSSQSSLILVIISVSGPSPSSIWTTVLWLWTTGESHERFVQGLGCGGVGWGPPESLSGNSPGKIHTLCACPLPPKLLLSWGYLSWSLRPQSHCRLLFLSHQVSHQSVAEAYHLWVRTLEMSQSFGRGDLTRSSWRTRDSFILVLKIMLVSFGHGSSMVWMWAAGPMFVSC